MRTRPKADGGGDPFLVARRPFKEILAPLGLWDAFVAMPKRNQGQFLKRVSPAPALSFDAAFPMDPALRKTLQTELAKTTFDYAGKTLPVSAFYSVLVPCLMVAKATVLMPDHGPAVTRFVLDGRERLMKAHDDYLKPTWRAMRDAVAGPLFANSRHDARHLHVNLEAATTPEGLLRCVVALTTVPAETRRVTLDGTGRTAYRAMSPHNDQWVTWDADVLGRPTPTPVYFQAHALRQLGARIDAPDIAPYAESWAGESLARPTIVERQPGGDLLVEFRVKDLRLGYLVVTPLADCAVVRTFLFLTMTPSPESRKLERRLKLTRHDADWLGLHELSAFTRTDLSTDATLRPMLDACGCGHLFELNDLDATPTPKPFAAEMKKYLRLAA